MTKYQVREYALQMSKKSDFRGSEAWVRKFLAKHNIRDLVYEFKVK